MLEIIALTADFMGKLLLGISVLFVHRRLRKERKIDKRVLNEMKREQLLVILGIILIGFGYILHLL